MGSSLRRPFTDEEWKQMTVFKNRSPDFTKTLFSLFGKVRDKTLKFINKSKREISETLQEPPHSKLDGNLDN